MTDWYERSTKALQLAGLANSSGAAYTRMLRQLVDFYGKALARANGDPSISLKSKAKASYAHALGSALLGDYPTALKEMRAAVTMAQSSDWMDMEVRIKQWSQEARKVDEQRQSAEPPAGLEGKSPTAETAGDNPATGL